MFFYFDNKKTLTINKHLSDIKPIVLKSLDQIPNWGKYHTKRPGSCKEPPLSGQKNVSDSIIEKC